MEYRRQKEKLSHHLTFRVPESVFDAYQTLPWAPTKLIRRKVQKLLADELTPKMSIETESLS